MTTLVEVGDATDLVTRFEALMSTVHLDCACEVTFRGALKRFTSLEHRRLKRKTLADARGRKDDIIARLAFLTELESLTGGESDRSAFAEAASLFKEIAAAAHEAADLLRSRVLVGPSY
ncbi:MAG: hypothetical protein IT534_08885 [Bauldia sp.]|nr:hypothetical protein [Bauldia sp.]